MLHGYNHRQNSSVHLNGNRKLFNQTEGSKKDPYYFFSILFPLILSLLYAKNIIALIAKTSSW